MKKNLFASVSTALVCAAVPASIHWSPATLTLFSPDRAEAEVGRPLTATSVAGVNRRAHRREYRRAVTGAAVGAAAAGADVGVPVPAPGQADVGVPPPGTQPPLPGPAIPLIPRRAMAQHPTGLMPRRAMDMAQHPTRLTPDRAMAMAQALPRLRCPRLWLRPRPLSGHCDREPCHRKVVQNRTERLSMVLDALAATQTS